MRYDHIKMRKEKKAKQSRHDLTNTVADWKFGSKNITGTRVSGRAKTSDRWSEVLQDRGVPISP